MPLHLILVRTVVDASAVEVHTILGVYLAILFVRMLGVPNSWMILRLLSTTPGGRGRQNTLFCILTSTVGPNDCSDKLGESLYNWYG